MGNSTIHSIQAERTLTKIIKDLQRAFPRKPYTPGHTIEEVMHTEGEQKVIQHLINEEERAKKYE